MFVDRQRELQWLQGGMDGRPQMRILYGRRRTGKSALIDEFVRGKRSIVFQAVEGSTGDHLADLTKSILAAEDDPVLRAGPLANWNAALAYFVRMAQQSPIVVILDEYQYVAEADRTLASVIQRWWSREVRGAPLYLILCGSYIRFFESNVLTGPAYGRNTGSWQLKPLELPEAALFFPGWGAEDQTRAFAVAGGMPYYLEQFDPEHTLSWNIVNRVLTRGTVLYTEAELLMREELREPRLYMSLLRAMANGATTTAELQNVLGVGAGRVSSYLANLSGLGLISPRFPIHGRRGVWTIEDPYLRFWFRWVHPNLTLLEHGTDPQRFYKQVVAPNFDHFVSMPTFEDICRAWVIRQVNSGRAARADDIRFWSGMVNEPSADNPKYQVRRELEIVGMDRNRVAIIGEAKWQAAAVGQAELNHTLAVARSISGYDAANPPETFLFGRQFEPHLVERAEREHIRLVGPEALVANPD